ncbi:hypothetical protein B0H14DRAFT_2641622 [Mycena olivaceomarginata]|nr:hypothetical protein B0H14DRAFT_2641622 [Mycena olivaceomarginata]
MRLRVQTALHPICSVLALHQGCGDAGVSGRSRAPRDTASPFAPRSRLVLILGSFRRQGYTYGRGEGGGGGLARILPREGGDVHAREDGDAMRSRSERASHCVDRCGARGRRGEGHRGADSEQGVSTAGLHSEGRVTMGKMENVQFSAVADGGARAADDRCLVCRRPTDTGEAGGGGEEEEETCASLHRRGSSPRHPSGIAFHKSSPSPAPSPAVQSTAPSLSYYHRVTPTVPATRCRTRRPLGRELRLPCLQPGCVMRQATQTSYDACRRTNRPRHWQRRTRVCSAGWGNGGWNIGVEAPPARPLTVSAVSKRRRSKERRTGRSKERRTGRREEGKWHICIDQRAPDRTLPPRGCSPYRTRRLRGEEEACMHRWRRRERERRKRWSGWGGAASRVLITNDPRHDIVSALLIFPFYFRARLPLLVFRPSFTTSFMSSFRRPVPFLGRRDHAYPLSLPFASRVGGARVPRITWSRGRPWREVEDTSRVMGGGRSGRRRRVHMVTGPISAGVSSPARPLALLWSFYPQNDSARIDDLITLSSHVFIPVQSHIICIPIHLTFLQPGLKMQEK